MARRGFGTMLAAKIQEDHGISKDIMPKPEPTPTNTSDNTIPGAEGDNVSILPKMMNNNIDSDNDSNDSDDNNKNNNDNNNNNNNNTIDKKKKKKRVIIEKDDLEIAELREVDMLRRIDNERKRLKDIKVKIKQTKDLIHLRNMKKIMDGKEKALALKKCPLQMIHVKCENKLDIMKKQYCIMTKQNEESKVKVNSLRKLKLTKLQQVERLKKRIKSMKSMIAKRHHRAQEMSQEKSKIERGVEKAKKKLVEDMQSHEDNVMDAVEALCTVTKNDISAQVKDVIHQLNQPEENHNSRGNNGTTNKSTVEAEAHYSDELTDQSKKSFWTISKKTFEIDKTGEKIYNLDRGISKLKDRTRVKSVQELIDLLMESEKINFELVTSINDLSNDLEIHQYSNTHLENQIEDINVIAAAKEEQTVNLKQRLEDQIKKANDTTQRYTNRYKQMADTLGTIQDPLIQIFKKIGCNECDEALGQQLEVGGITEYNITSFLGLIEERIIDILRVYSTIVGDGDTTTPASDPTRPTTPRLNTNGERMPCTEKPQQLPGVNDNEEDEDAENILSNTGHPLSIIEIKKIVKYQADKKLEKSKQQRNEIGGSKNKFFMYR